MAQWNRNTVSEITDKVTAWMKLPKPYEPRVKELTELMGGTE